ncbi:MAG: hypothetical protein ACRC80_34815, partial [Waterburya sp.]
MTSFTGQGFQPFVLPKYKSARAIANTRYYLSINGSKGCHLWHVGNNTYVRPDLRLNFLKMGTCAICLTNYTTVEPDVRIREKKSAKIPSPPKRRRRILSEKVSDRP